MKNSFSLAIALPGKHLQTFEVRQIKLPSKGGYIGVMAGRQPLLATLEPGLISIIDIHGRHLLFGTTGGFAEMLDNQASLLCDSLLEAKDLDLSDKSVPADKFYLKDTANMSEQQKREYVKQMMTYRLRQELATDSATTKITME